MWELILYRGATIFSPRRFAILGKSATKKIRETAISPWQHRYEFIPTFEMSAKLPHRSWRQWNKYYSDFWMVSIVQNSTNKCYSIFAVEVLQISKVVITVQNSGRI
jgi:hypothetical protein